MIFLDTNVFLRHLVQPATPAGREMQEIASALFASIEDGDQRATTTEAVIHEVCCVLASKKHYNLAAADIAALVVPILSLPNLRLPRGDKQLYRRAFDIYVDRPALEFADAIVAARCERLNVPLATFDERLAKVPSITRWHPPARSTNGR